MSHSNLIDEFDAQNSSSGVSVRVYGSERDISIGLTCVKIPFFYLRSPSLSLVLYIYWSSEAQYNPPSYAVYSSPHTISTVSCVFIKKRIMLPPEKKKKKNYAFMLPF